MATTFKVPKNGSKSLVATAPSPAVSGTTLVVTSGQGSRFALGWATIWAKGTNYDARDDVAAETVLITAISTDTLTITRAQLGSSARTVVVGDAIEMLLVDQQFKDIHTAVNNIENGNFKVAQRQGGTTGDASWHTTGTSNTDTSAKNVIIQVGSIATSSSADTSVTFPQAFNQAPIVTFGIHTQAGDCHVVSTGTTTTGISNIRTVNNADSRVAETVHWVAIGQ